MTLRTTKAHEDSAESRAAKLFLSHSTQDDAIVRALQRALGDLGQDVWSDARELRGGDPLSSEIQQAIEQAAGYAVVISAASLQSRWVGKELRHALEVQQQKQRDGKRYPVKTPARQTRDDFRTALRNRMGELPDPPAATGFVGRSRELLALERLLGQQRHAVLRGQGGEGKTALAAEFARWMVRSQQIRRAAFVSVETHGTARAVLDAIGRQLMPSYSVATFEGPDAAEQAVARVLSEQSTLLVVDNLESILVPPYLAADTPEALSEDARAELEAILALCERLGSRGETRILFTSREPLPAPFDGAASRRELHRLGREDAVKLVERVVSEGAATAGVADAARAEIEELVEAVNGHARTLALLAPALRRLGVAATREALVDLMADMERRFPGHREQSLFASVEMSLGRLSPDNRDRARVLGLFHGGGRGSDTRPRSSPGELACTRSPGRHALHIPGPGSMLCPGRRGRRR